MLDWGTKTRTYAQIKDAFDKAQARVFFYTRGNYYGSGQTAMMGIQTDKPHLNSVLDVALDCLRNPIFPADEFEKRRLVFAYASLFVVADNANIRLHHGMNGLVDGSAALRQAHSVGTKPSLA